jgi:glycosyltransferase involved in cell wall biosynthesis
VQPRRILRRARREGRSVAALVDTEVDLLRSRRGRADVALFHEFAPSPSGGGHQFLRALLRELEGRGLALEVGTISGDTPVCLFNSFNFDFRRLQRFARRGARMVHRVDGPIGAYRGFDDGTDARIAEINAALASTTIFQSEFSLAKHRELGFELREPVVIPNAVDPAIFHPPASREPLEGRRVRLIASSWSDNPRKGVAALEWLERNLDLDRFELTFAGRAPATHFERIRVVGPLDSPALAELLRTQDLYVAPSWDDPCSNALLEALACGLPAAYRDSGGHPELVGEAGVPFREDGDVGAAIERLVSEIDARRASIETRSISWVADRYLEVLGVRPGP